MCIFIEIQVVSWGPTYLGLKNKQFKYKKLFPYFYFQELDFIDWEKYMGRSTTYGKSYKI